MTAAPNRTDSAGPWTQRTRDKARLLHEQILNLSLKIRDEGADDGWTDLLVAPYYQRLESLYERELPLAQAADDSDLLVHIEGPAVEDESPRVGLVTSLLQTIRDEVRRLSKAVAGIAQATTIDSLDLDVGVSGYARGSLYLGFKVQAMTPKHGQHELLGNEEPLLKATREALRALGVVVSHLAEEDATAQAAIAKEIEDPRVRDAAVLAVSRIAPTHRRNVSSIQLSGPSLPPSAAEHPLTQIERRTTAKWARKPVRTQEQATFTGWVREIDLDARRLDLRRIQTLTITDLRCLWRKDLASDTEARAWLNAQVEVTGQVERQNGEPRLMQIESVKVMRAAPNEAAGAANQLSLPPAP